MSDPTSGGLPGDDRGQKAGRIAIWALLVAALAAIVAVVALLLTVVDDGSDDATQPSTTTQTSSSSTTSEPATSSTTTSTSTTTSASTTTSTTSTSTTTQPVSTTSTIPPGLTPAVWPWYNSDLRYTDPVDAARGFAEEYIGMEEPLVGEFLAGDSRSGEVEIRAVENGAVTVAFLRQLGADELWWVTGSATENVVVDIPAVLDVIDGPLVVSGQARASEGTVFVALRADGEDEPLADTVITTSGGTDFADFYVELPFSDPDAEWGAVVVHTESAEDGQVWEAGAIRVQFG